MRRKSPGQQDAQGFALILVVWILVLVGAIGSYLVVNGRSESAIAHNVRAAAAAESLADAGVARAVFNQTDPDLSGRWALDGRPHRISLPGGNITIRLEDEAQKINPNLASDALLAALFEVSGVERRTARRLGAAVADWVSASDEARAQGAKLNEYRAAGRSYGPPNAPVESLDELQLVLGMTPAILASVRPYLTIHTQAPAPDGQGASLVVQRAIALAAHRQTATDAASPADAPPPAAPQTPPARLIATYITARSGAGGVFVRYAVLKLQPQGARSYTVLDWQRGALQPGVSD